MADAAQLNLNESIVAYSDTGLTNNPLMRYFDWTRNINGLTVYNPKAEQLLVPPRSMLSVFNGIRATSFDGSTQITSSFLVDSTYRFSWTGGTDPGFADLNDPAWGPNTITIAVLPNEAITMTADAAIFTGVAAGSTVYVYNTTDNPSAAFNPLNAGEWVVLANTADTTLTLARPTGTPFQAYTETVTCEQGGNMQYFIPSTVQVGDKVRIATPFAPGNQGTYTVTAVTAMWIDVVSTVPLVSEAVLPSTTGMVFYTGGKRFVRVETDRRAIVYINGSNSDTQELDPWQAGDRKLMAWQERVGPVWSLTVYNLSTSPMAVNIFSAE